MTLILPAWQHRDRGSADVKALARQRVEVLDRKIAELASLRSILQERVEHSHRDDRPDCPIIKDLASGGCWE